MNAPTPLQELLCCAGCWCWVLGGVGGSCQILEINIVLMQRPGLLLVSVFCPVFMGYLQQLYTLSHLSQQVNVLDNNSQVDRILTFEFI